jgi:dihydrofolate synthase/folylpolyglutamate synthase
VAGELISEEAFIKVLDECWETNDRQEITFFEITTVAALLAFARTPADWTLLEVGLGGRLDATNVVETPAMTVITPVDYDHQQYLGETIPEIAFEKAGIIKRGVPCVVGPQHEAGLEVIERQAAKMGAPVLACGQHWHVQEERGRLVYQDEHGLLDLPPPNLPGPHQFMNAGAALAVLRHLGYGEDACEAAVTKAYWPARMQRMKHGPLVEAAGAAELWLDGGHNPSAGAVIAETIRRMPARPTHLICGMLKTKDPVGFLTHLRPVAESLTSIAIPGETATLSAEETAKAGETAGFPARIAASPMDAVQAIVAADPGARILICGSLYLAGSVLRENG